MMYQYRPPIPYENNTLQQGAEYNAPLKAKGFFARLPHQRRIFLQKMGLHDLRVFAAVLSRLRSRLVANVCFQFRAISGGSV